MTSVLVVEDDKAIQELLGFSLGAAGYSVTHALSAEIALESIKRELPDVVVPIRVPARPRQQRPVARLPRVPRVEPPVRGLPVDRVILVARLAIQHRLHRRERAVGQRLRVVGDVRRPMAGLKHIEVQPVLPVDEHR